MTQLTPSHRFTVSSYGYETVKQRYGTSKLQRNTGETTSLKLLALQVLERNKQENKNETKPFHSVYSTEVRETELLTYYAELYEERSAIYQYDGGYSRTEAEWKAMNDTLAMYSNAQNIAAGSGTFKIFMLALHGVTGFINHQKEM